MAYIDINGDTQDQPNTDLGGGDIGPSPTPTPINPDHGPNESAFMPSNPGAPALGNPSLSANQVQAAYQQTFGRTASAQELASELENANKYGAQGILNSIAARTNNAPGTGQSGTARWTGSVPSGGVPSGGATTNPYQDWLNQEKGLQWGAPGVSGGATTNPYQDWLNQEKGLQWGAPGVQTPGTQFSDPYTKLLEQIAQNQLQTLQGQNPQTQQVMDFLNAQFANLSQSQGYTPSELAVLQTQALEPIEARRQAAQQQELLRTARAGYLPTSGITLDQQRLIDQQANQDRTVVGRDLAINAINQQNAKRQQALALGQLGMQIPQQQNQQAIDVAQLLYQLPRTAMADANNVINASSPSQAIGPYVQLLQQNQQQAQFNQQQQQQFWSQIAQQLAGMFGG